MPRAPQKINPFVVIDFETGGVDKKDNLHAQKYPITEFAGMAIDPITFKEIIRYDNLVKPYDENLIYDEEAALHTGINKQMCIQGGIELKQLADDICQLLEEANIHNSKTAKPIFVAHNWSFDRQFLQDIFRRTKIDLSKYVSGGYDCYGNFIPDGIDSIWLAKYCWGEITDTTTKFQLSHCCQRAGIDCIDAHHAINDVIPTADLMKYFVSRLRSGSNEVTMEQGQVSIHRQTFEW